MADKTLFEIIGNVPEKQDSFIRRMRFHQGWWRACVLNQKEGEYSVKNTTAKVCNRINEGEKTNLNFINKEAINAALKTIQTRQANSKGMIDEKRLYNNLLSSQPLAFNFFGLLSHNLQLCTKFIQTIIPQVNEVTEVLFEYAPPLSRDNSAFDIAIIAKINNKPGFIGFECKYTDSFSYKNSKNIIYCSDKSEKYSYYRKIFDNHSKHFLTEYDNYALNKDYNQLFRNEILGRIMSETYDYVYTGLFLHQDDAHNLNAGMAFQKLLPNKLFVVLTYFDFIERIQKLQLTKEEREWSMMLWNRYSGELSNTVYQEL